MDTFFGGVCEEGKDVYKWGRPCSSSFEYTMTKAACSLVWWQMTMAMMMLHLNGNLYFYCTFIEVQESMIVCWLFPPMHSCILVCVCSHVCTCIFYVLVLAFGCTLLPKSRQQNKKERMYADVCH